MDSPFSFSGYINSPLQDIVDVRPLVRFFRLSVQNKICCSRKSWRDEISPILRHIGRHVIERIVGFWGRSSPENKRRSLAFLPLTPFFITRLRGPEKALPVPV